MIRYYKTIPGKYIVCDADRVYETKPKGKYCHTPTKKYKVKNARRIYWPKLGEEPIYICVDEQAKKFWVYKPEEGKYTDNAGQIWPSTRRRLKTHFVEISPIEMSNIVEQYYKDNNKDKVMDRDNMPTAELYNNVLGRLILWLIIISLGITATAALWLVLW